MTRAAYILNGARTAFTKIGTDLKAVSATDLGRAAAVEAMARARVEPGEIDQAIFGNIATPPDAANIGRVIALRAGIPKERPAHSVARGPSPRRRRRAPGRWRKRPSDRSRSSRTGYGLR